MIICKQCGAENTDDTKFCKDCGANLAPVQQTPDVQKLRCPKCGSTDVQTKMFQENKGSTTIGIGMGGKQKKSHGCLYWCTIGWFIWLMKWTIGFIPALIGKIRHSGVGVAKSKNQIDYKTVHICQHCGNTF